MEWETGNVASSHGALNKIFLGILNGILSGGTLILPCRKSYSFLTDRIGNYQELSPYFIVWRNFNSANDYLSVIKVEHDDIDINVP